MDVFHSPDTRRAIRLPPGHTRAFALPAGFPGGVPPFDPATWSLAVFPVPLVDRVWACSWAEFVALPRVRVFADHHTVDGVSVLDNLWEGVPVRAVLGKVRLHDDARFVMTHGEYGASGCLPLADLLEDDVLLATHHNGEPLSPDHGGPVRLVVPRRFAHHGRPWVRGFELMSEHRPGVPDQPAAADPWGGG